MPTTFYTGDSYQDQMDTWPKEQYLQHREEG